jgi:hypothetical protein
VELKKASLYFEKAKRTLKRLVTDFFSLIRNGVLSDKFPFEAIEIVENQSVIFLGEVSFFFQFLDHPGDSFAGSAGDIG